MMNPSSLIKQPVASVLNCPAIWEFCDQLVNSFAGQRMVDLLPVLYRVHHLIIELCSNWWSSRDIDQIVRHQRMTKPDLVPVLMFMDQNKPKIRQIWNVLNGLDRYQSDYTNPKFKHLHPIVNKKACQLETRVSDFILSCQHLLY